MDGMVVDDARDKEARTDELKRKQFAAAREFAQNPKSNWLKKRYLARQRAVDRAMGFKSITPDGL